MTDSNFVYMTVLSTDSYIPGVIKLYKSLMATKPQYPFLCACSRNISDVSIQKLNEKGIKCIKLQRCAVDNITSLENDINFSHWKYTYDKLLLFGLTEFRKIVYLDSDMLILENIDELFDCKPFSAVPAGYLINNEWTRLNSGLMVIEPNMDIMQKMLKLIAPVYHKRKEQGLATGDQDIINEYIPEWSNKKDLILPESYNLIFKYLDIYKKKFNFQYNNQDKTRTIKVVHFIGKNKPWNRNFIKNLLSSVQYIIQHNYGLKAYLKYIFI